MPRSLLGKELEVEHHSMKDCVAELAVDDTWLTAHMLSRAVLGRYHTEVSVLGRYHTEVNDAGQVLQ
jgi:hypothetical protein